MNSMEEFDRDGDRAPIIYIPITVFAVLCPLSVAARLWSRWYKGIGPGADDFTIILSLVRPHVAL